MRPRLGSHRRSSKVRSDTLVRDAYEIEDTSSMEVLSRHRTLQGAVDAWRQRHKVRIYRSPATGERTLVVDGIWHEAKRG